MFIKDGVYREIDVKVDAPIAEGTILTFGGALAAEDASDAFGIVPENIYVLPPTKKIRVAIGGTIDLDDPANKGVEFSEAIVNALGADINFVPAAEAGGGGGSDLPEYSSTDAGKALVVDEEGNLSWDEPEITPPVDYEPVLPQQELAIVDVGWSDSFSGDPIVEGGRYRLILDGVTYEPLTAAEGESASVCLGNVYIEDGDPQGDYSFCVVYFSGDDRYLLWTEDSTAEHVTVRIDEYIEQTTVPKPTAEDLGKTLTVQKTGHKKGTVIIPEQTLTTTGQPPLARISNYNTGLWVVGQKVVVCINDMEYESVLNAANGIADFYSDDDDYAIILDEGVMGFSAPANDDYVVSAYICEDVYGYVPGGGGYDAEFTIYHSNNSADDYVFTRVSGDFATLKAMCESGDWPFFRVRVTDSLSRVHGATDVVAVYGWGDDEMTLFVHAPLSIVAPNNIWKTYAYITWNIDNTITMD